MSNNNTIDPRLWIASYGDYLFAYCFRRVGHKETAEDLVQETFISAIKSKEAFRGDSSERTWLVAILKNKIIDYYRKKDVLKDTQEYLSSTEQSFSDAFFHAADGHWVKEASPREWSASADASIDSAEFDSILRECVHKMPSKLVPIFIAKFFDEENAETICKVHNITPSNYWVIIHRSKVLIRSCLEKNWFLSKSSV